MYTPKVELKCFDDLPTRRKLVVLRNYLEALIATDWVYLQEYRERTGKCLPSIYEFAPRYILKTRPGGLDSWQDIPRCIELGTADCKDLVAWRIAELRDAGYDGIFPHIKTSYHDDPRRIEPTMTVYHIQVLSTHDIDGRGQQLVIEDPSARLGMPNHVTYEQLRM